jgi:hypothetical protein
MSSTPLPITSCQAGKILVLACCKPATCLLRCTACKPRIADSIQPWPLLYTTHNRGFTQRGPKWTEGWGNKYMIRKKTPHSSPSFRPPLWRHEGEKSPNVRYIGQRHKSGDMQSPLESPGYVLSQRPYRYSFCRGFIFVITGPTQGQLRDEYPSSRSR